MHNLIELLCKYGTLAKKAKEQKKRTRLYYQMAEICDQLRPIEPEFKAVYPQYSELFDYLLAMKDSYGK